MGHQVIINPDKNSGIFRHSDYSYIADERKKFMRQGFQMMEQDWPTQSKIFAVGFNKTGTSSLHSLFIALGLRSYHGERWRNETNSEFFDRYDCFSDGIPRDLSALDGAFPNSKFILQVRSLEAWVSSRLCHIAREKAQDSSFRGPLWNNTEYAVKHWIKQRNAHHLHVFDYFSDRPGDLLVVNYIRDGRSVEKICKFLGLPPVDIKPKKNKGLFETDNDTFEDLFLKAATSLNLTESEYSYDIYCPSLLADSSSIPYPPDTRYLDRTHCNH